MRKLLEMRWSLAGLAVCLALGLLSMGALGAALYYACYPLLGPFYGRLESWKGDWVWPATILAGMLWSVGFIAAGCVDLLLKRRGCGSRLRGVGYVMVLWLMAAAIWSVLLLSMRVAPDEAARSEAMACGHGNRVYVEKGLAAVFGPTPRLIDGSRCLKTAYSSDMVAMAELAADSAPPDTRFLPIEEAIEAPLDFTRSMYPEIFADLAPGEQRVASGFDNALRVSVHLLRLKDGRLFVFVHDFM